MGLTHLLLLRPACNGNVSHFSLFFLTLAFLIECNCRDAPNSWPPHQYIVLQALRALPKSIRNNTIPSPPSGQSTYAFIPSGQLGLTESQLPGQILRGNQNATQTGSAADINSINNNGVVTVSNGGDGVQGEGWADTLERQLANRYITSAFCSW